MQRSELAPRFLLGPSASRDSVVVVVVVLEVRGVAVNQRVAVLVEAVEDPEPRQSAEPVRPTLVEHARLVQGQALVGHAGTAAACRFFVGSRRTAREEDAGVSEGPELGCAEVDAASGGREPRRERVRARLGLGARGETDARGPIDAPIDRVCRAMPPGTIVGAARSCVAVWRSAPAAKPIAERAAIVRGVGAEHCGDRRVMRTTPNVPSDDRPRDAER